MTSTDCVDEGVHGYESPVDGLVKRYNIFPEALHDLVGLHNTSVSAHSVIFACILRSPMGSFFTTSLRHRAQATR